MAGFLQESQRNAILEHFYGYIKTPQSAMNMPLNATMVRFGIGNKTSLTVSGAFDAQRRVKGTDMPVQDPGFTQVELTTNDYGVATEQDKHDLLRLVEDPTDEFYRLMHLALEREYDQARYNLFSTDTLLTGGTYALPSTGAGSGAGASAARTITTDGRAERLADSARPSVGTLIALHSRMMRNNPGGAKICLLAPPDFYFHMRMDKRAINEDWNKKLITNMAMVDEQDATLNPGFTGFSMFFSATENRLGGLPSGAGNTKYAYAFTQDSMILGINEYMSLDMQPVVRQHKYDIAAYASFGTKVVLPQNIYRIAYNSNEADLTTFDRNSN